MHLFALFGGGQGLFPLLRRLQQPVHLLYPVRQRLCEGGRQLELGHRYGQRLCEQLLLLSAGLTFLLAQLYPARLLAALPDGADALPEIRGGRRRRLFMGAPVRQAAESGGHRRMPVRLFRLYHLQHLFLHLCGRHRPVPVPALGAGRGGVRGPAGAVRLCGGGQFPEQLLLLCRADRVPGVVFCLQMHHPLLAYYPAAVRAAGL